ncbi:MAG: isoprenylcysteine carboxylmethyltransferase family protein [Alphaproteobacteria bacterium]
MATLVVSIRNEKALKRDGGVEIGAANSTLLAAVHIAFYVAVIAEGTWRGAPLDGIAMAGIATWAFGAVMLVVVMRLLGPQWTVKIIIGRDHRLVTHPLFRAVRHPNYFLGILPELAGLAIALHAWIVLVAGLALYAIPLVIRIRQEEAAMRARFAAY